MNHQAEQRVDGFLDSLNTFLSPDPLDAVGLQETGEPESNVVLFPSHLPAHDDAIALSSTPPIPAVHLPPTPALLAAASPPSLNLDQSLEALLAMIAPDHSRSETVSALRQVVDLLSDDTVAATATKAELQQLHQLYDDLQTQLNHLQAQIDPVQVQPSSDTAIAPDPTTPPPEASTIESSASDEIAPEATPPAAVTLPPDPSHTDPEPASSSQEGKRDRDRASKSASNKPRIAWPGVILAGLTLLTWGGYHYLTRHQRQLQQQLEQAVTTDPDLSLYRLQANVQGNSIILKGTVPDRSVRQQLTDLSQHLAPNHQIRNEIIVMDSPVMTAVQQTAATLNALEANTIQAQFEAGHVTLIGTTPSPENRDIIQARFQELTGVLTVDNQITVQPLSIPTRLYFGQNSATVPTVDRDAKLLPIRDVLQRHPHLTVNIVGYAHASETNPQQVAQSRAQAVQTLLEDYGIDRRRLLVTAGTSLPPNVQAEQDRWLHRTVVFEWASPDATAATP
jgi:outer membrane protein OmpA-like peptidoglycan-associated protein